MGLEPTTPCLQSRCSSQLSYVPAFSSMPRRECSPSAEMLVTAVGVGGVARAEVLLLR
jgi:hypothetical protein